MIGLIETKKNAKTYEISAFLAPPSRVELLAFRLGELAFQRVKNP